MHRGRADAIAFFPWRGMIKRDFKKDGKNNVGNA